MEEAQDCDSNWNAIFSDLALLASFCTQIPYCAFIYLQSTLKILSEPQAVIKSYKTFLNRDFDALNVQTSILIQNTFCEI